MVVIAMMTVMRSAAAWDPHRPPGVPLGAAFIVLAVPPRLLGPEDDFPGMWEYVYDAYGGGCDHYADPPIHGTWFRSHDLFGFDGRLMVNRWTDDGQLWDGTGDSADYKPKQNWTPESQGIPRPASGNIDLNRFPSYWTWSPFAWQSPDDIKEINWYTYEYEEDARPAAPNMAWAMENTWHGAEYYNGNHLWRVSSVSENGIHFYNNNGYTSGHDWMSEGLSNTFRVVHPYAPGPITWQTYHQEGATITGSTLGPVLSEGTAYLEGAELFYNGKFADAGDPLKVFLSPGLVSEMTRVGDDLVGHVTNYVNGITGIRLKFTSLVTFPGAVADAFSFEATPEQSSDKTFSALIPPTPPTFVQDDSSGKTVVTITFTDGEIKNRWLKTIIDASQIGEDEDAELIIGSRVGDVDGNYRCLLNDAITIRTEVSGALVGISNACDIDKNGRVLLNEAIMARNAVTGIALPALP